MMRTIKVPHPRHLRALRKRVSTSGSPSLEGDMPRERLSDRAGLPTGWAPGVRGIWRWLERGACRHLWRARSGLGVAYSVASAAKHTEPHERARSFGTHFFEPRPPISIGVFFKPPMRCQLLRKYLRHIC